MRHEYAASAGRIKLVPITEQDSQKYREIRNREENRCKFVFSDIISEESQAAWYAKYLQLSNDCMFAVYNNENEFIGGNAIYNIDNDAKTAEYGRLLIDKDKCEGGNWGYEATKAALEVAFHVLDLEKVYLEVYADNIPAYKTYLKAGFVRKSIQKDPNGAEMYYMEIERNSKSKVQILTSTYNGDRHLEEQLESVFRQKDVEVEFLIRDDGSKDNTVNLLQKWEEKTGRVVWWHEPNIGATPSYMEVIKRAGKVADYYAYCDQDDVWEEDKLCAAVERLKELDDSIPLLYYSNVKRCGANLEEIDDPFKKDYHVEDFGGVLVCPRATGSTMVWNNAMMEALQQYVPKCKIWPDAWTINLCAALGGKVVYDPIPHIKYRRHDTNVTGRAEQLGYSKFKLLKYRIGKFFNNSYKPIAVAEDLLTGYAKQIPAGNKEIIEKMIRAKNGFTKRMAVITDKRIKTPYLINNLKFWWQMLIGKA